MLLPHRCCCEYFVFSLFAEMQPEMQELQLYALTNNGTVHRYPKGMILDAQRMMPSGGDLTNPADREAIRMLEDNMIEVYGGTIIRKACAASPTVDLSGKMIRHIHIPELGRELAEHGVTTLDLSRNQLCDFQGGVALAEALKMSPMLQSLK